MGRVYLGVMDGRFAAVKQLLASVVAEDQGFVRRFGQELDNLARLPAGATAPLLAGDRDAEPPWLATEFVPGVTLAETVERHGGVLDGPGLWSLLLEAAAGLAPVHALGMVHRDLKPSNVMLTARGVTLIDFGIARAAEQSRLTRTGLIVGTPAYMSPEQASGSRRLTGASDVFALGLLVAYAAGGRWPFGEGEGDPLYRIVHDEPDLGPVRERDPRLADAVAACLDKDPEGRPAVAEILETALGYADLGAPAWPGPLRAPLAERAEFAARVPEGTSAPPPVPDTGATGAGARAPRRERRRRTRVLLAVVPVVVVATGTTLALRHLPYDAGRDGAAGPQSSVSSGAPADPAASTGPTGSPLPAAKRSGGAKKKDGGKKGKKTDGGAGKGEAGASAAGAGTAGTAGGANGGDGGGAGAGGQEASGTGTGNTGTGDTGKGDTGTGGTGGNSTTGGGSSSGGGSTTAPTTGTFRLKNADNSSCLTQVYGSADDGSCSDASASWKTVSAENNSFKVVNKRSGSCLVANMNGQAVFVGDCTQGAARLWRWGTGGALRSTSNGGCLDLAYGGGVSTQTCASSKASQRWGRT
ncbi:protein kinase [Streptomyces sp. NPDC102467]|uniref:serine/threonine-protein kinase n=1 Tax=Streptomyces sp. NPDC102467 TaxID=3366179 RepID=UPI003804D27F